MRSENVLQQKISGEANWNASSSRRSWWWHRWLAPVGLLCTASGLHLLASINPSLVEYYYSRGLYLHLGRLLAYVNKPLSFSISEALAIALLAMLAGGAAWQTRQLYRRRVKARELALTDLRVLLWAAGGGALFFLLVWGLNYQRRPLADSLQLEQRRAGNDELAALCRTIIAGINRNYAASHTNGLARGNQAPLSSRQLFDVLETAYQQQTSLLGDASGGGFGPPKPAYFSRLMSRFSISGIYVPFTGEPNFNAEQPAWDLPFSVAHEMAHQRGYAREDEADFIAFLVCINSSHPYVRYSGYLHAINVLGILADVAPQRYHELVASLLPGARADIDRSNSFWLRQEGAFSQATYKVTDAYLKINRVNSGLRSYDEVVALIIGYYLTHRGGESAGKNSPSPTVNR